MNKELQYSVQAVLLVVLLFSGIKLFNFCLSVSSNENNIVAVIDNSDTTNITTDEYLLKGKELFQTNCSSCHSFNRALTGPALAGVEERVPSKKILYEWIKNNQKVLRSGDPYFTAVFNSFNKLAMPVFPDLTDEDIDAILKYINAKAQTAMPVIAAL